MVVTNNDDAYRTAITLKQAGLEVPVILDARAGGGGALAEAARGLGIRVENGKGIAKVKGGKRVEGVAICAQAGEGAVLEEVPATRWPCPAAGRRWCTCGRIAAAS